MRHAATMILWPILLIAGGYALGIGALGIALPAVAAALVLLSFILRTPAPQAGDNGAVTKPAVGNPLQAEIARSRRHNRSFALIRLPWTSSSTSGDMPRDSRSTTVALDALRANVRIVDHVWGEPDGAYILLPESGPENVKPFLSRLGTKLNPEALLLSRTAIYPKDGPTEQAILGHLRERERAAVGGRSGMSSEWSEELIDPQHPLAS